MNGRVSISVDGCRLGAYCESEQGKGTETVDLLHEILGVNVDVRQTCDWLAREGVDAVCPDLSWRPKPGVELGDGSWSSRYAIRLRPRRSEHAAFPHSALPEGRTRH